MTRPSRYSWYQSGGRGINARGVQPPLAADARVLAARVVPVSGTLCTRLPRAGRHATGVLATSRPNMVLARALRSRSLHLQSMVQTVEGMRLAKLKVWYCIIVHVERLIDKSLFQGQVLLKDWSKGREFFRP